MACVFCDIVAGRTTAHFIYEDEICVAILDRYPIDRGHSLLMPRHHIEMITDMEDDQVGSLFARVPKIAKALMCGTGADSFNVGQNNGRSARQIVPHVHVHIVPRYNSTGAGWTQRTIARDEDLAKLAAVVRASF